MEEIKNTKELKVGDWLCNQGIFRANENNNLSEYKICFSILGLNEEGKFLIKCWQLEDGKVTGKGYLERAEILFLLDEKEADELKRKIMAESL